MVCFPDQILQLLVVPPEVEADAVFQNLGPVAAMENAVKDENYELAMKLKEEIDSRHHSNTTKVENTKDKE